MKKWLPNANSSIEEYELFSDVDYIVTDIDGTLTIGTKPVFEQIQRKVVRLRRLGVKTTIATGRSLYGASKLAEELKLPTRIPIALYNGAVLIEYKTSNLLGICTIAFDALLFILALLAEEGTGIFIYTFELNSDFFYSQDEIERVSEKVYYTGRSKVELDVNGCKVQPVSLKDIVDENIVSILIVRNEISDKKLHQLLDFFLSENEITFTDSGSGFIEVKGKTLNKSEIVRELKKNKRYENNRPKKVLAIGDNDNDFDMLIESDISVAVSNASMMIQNNVNFLCRNENAKGFLDMLTVIERARHYYK